MSSHQPEYDQRAQLLHEAEETLRAIRFGTVDAFVVEEPEGHRVYTLEGSDLPYSALVERMQQGAAMLDANGCIIYGNLSLAKLLDVPGETLIGLRLQDFLDAADLPLFKKLLDDAFTESSEGELQVRRADGTVISALFAFRLLSRDKTATGVLITDLTAQKAQGEMAARLQRLQDDERRNIARELHDSVGQLLAAISMNDARILTESGKLSPAGARRVADNAILVQQVSSEIRTISYLLHPPLLDIAGLVSAIRWYADGYSTRSKIQVILDIPDDFGRLPEHIEIALFRIIQECLTNIHRHSGSTTASIRLAQEGKRITLQVKDSGKGIPVEKQRELIESGRGGVGFAGMRERLKQLGGSLEIQAAEPGTIVIATLEVAEAGVATSY